MQLTKKQVKSLLEVMSSDKTREVLTTAYIDEFEDKYYLVATDGYTLAAIILDTDASGYVGRFVKRDDLIRWYKLASTKDVLTEQELLIGMSRKALQSDASYPNWKDIYTSIIKSKFETDTFHINADYFKTMQELVGGLPVKYLNYHNAFIAKQELGMFIIMKLKDAK